MHEIQIKKGKINVDLLLKYGFKDTDKGFFYFCHILNGQMTVSFLVDKNGRIFSELTDEFGEEYTLHLNESASGNFVGAVKSEYESKVNEILESILEYSVFKSLQAQKIIEYIEMKYHSKLEFLWDDDNGIARRIDNKKWYVVFMTIPKSKLGFKDNTRVEVINLRLTENEAASIIDNARFFPAYHMNKRYWVTVLLDSGVEYEHILKLIDNSYELVATKTKGALQ